MSGIVSFPVECIKFFLSELGGILLGIVLILHYGIHAVCTAVEIVLHRTVGCIGHRIERKCSSVLPVSLHERNERLYVTRPLKQAGVHDQSVAYPNLQVIAWAGKSRVAVVVHLRAAHGCIMICFWAAVSVISDDIKPVFIAALSFMVADELVHMFLKRTLSVPLSIADIDFLAIDDFHKILRYVSNLLSAVVSAVSEIVSEFLVEKDDVFSHVWKHLLHVRKNGIFVDEGILVGIGFNLCAVYVHVFSWQVHFRDKMEGDIIEDFINIRNKIFGNQSFKGHEARLLFLCEPYVSHIMCTEILHLS